MTKFAVFFGTTAAPVRVENIVQRDKLPRSIVRKKDEFADLSEVNADYIAFTEALAANPHPISEWFGSGATNANGKVAPRTFDVRLSDTIETGTSWLLSALLAHGLHANDLLGRCAPEEGVSDTTEHNIWCSGDIGVSLAVQPIEDINKKLEKSEALFDEWRRAGQTVTIVVPADQKKNIDKSLIPTTVEVLYVNSATQLFEHFDVPLPTSSATGADQSAKFGNKRRNLAVAASLLAILALTTAGLVGNDVSPIFSVLEARLFGETSDATASEPLQNSGSEAATAENENSNRDAPQPRDENFEVGSPRPELEPPPATNGEILYEDGGVEDGAL